MQSSGISIFVGAYMYIFKKEVKSQPSCKSCNQDLKKGCDEKDVKSKGVAKACAGMLIT